MNIKPTNLPFPILYVDMDGVVANLHKKVSEIEPSLRWQTDFDDDLFNKICNDFPDIFEHLEPIDGAIDSLERLSLKYEIFFLSTPMWDLPESFKSKRLWIEKHFPLLGYKKLILTHRKDLNIGHFLVDDRTANGAEKFNGKHIQFGTRRFLNWDVVEKYLMSRF